MCKLITRSLLVRRLICLIRDHHYVPAYDVVGYQRPHCPNGKVYKERVQYTCECCKRPTKWMSKKQHEAFIQKYHPTWGGRGSDSQGTRRKALGLPPETYDDDPNCIG